MRQAKGTLIDVHGAPLRRRRASAFSLFGGSGFAGAGSDRQQTRGWSTGSIPSTTETYGGRGPVGARARDTVRNNGNAKGAQSKQVARVVGKGRRFICTPDHEVLGIEPKAARALGRAIQRELHLWGSGPRPQCDIGRQLSYGQLQRVLFIDRYTAGESLALVRWRPDRGTRYATCVQCVDPERLSNANDRFDTVERRQGVHFSEDGEAIAYDIRRAHPGDMAFNAGRMEWDTLDRFDEADRPIVVHGFTSDRSEQVRGISAFAPILLAFRDVQRFSEAEIGAAILNGLYAGFIQSNFDPAIIAEEMGLESQQDLAEASGSIQDMRASILGDGLRFGDNIFQVLPPGDEVKMTESARDTNGFNEFQKAFFRGISSGLGMDYPTFANDLEGVNYSSIRYGLSAIWDLVTAEGFEFDCDTLNPIEFAVIQEAFERGYVRAPDGALETFESMPQAYLKGRHIGPGRPQIDRIKEAQGSALEIELGLNSATNIAEESGRTLEEVYADLADEAELREQYKITPAGLAEVGQVRSGNEA